FSCRIIARSRSSTSATAATSPFANWPNSCSASSGSPERSYGTNRNRMGPRENYWIVRGCSPWAGGRRWIWKQASGWLTKIFSKNSPSKKNELTTDDTDNTDFLDPYSYYTFAAEGWAKSSG